MGASHAVLVQHQRLAHRAFDERGAEQRPDERGTAEPGASDAAGGARP